jgi:2-oxoglutarate dehydrogenase E2 component (dihydrolipoamide succinyltransferase)
VATGTQTEVVMPQMGVSVTEGTVTKWLKQPGDTVALDEPLLEISTDKVDTEVPSPGEGVLSQILVDEGVTVDVGTVLAVIGPAGAQAAAPPSPPEPTPAPVEPRPESPPEPVTQPAADAASAASSAEGGPPVPPDAPDTAVSAPVPPAPPAADQGDQTDRAGQADSAGQTDNGRTFVSPVVARIAAEHGVDPGRIQGTGAGGRVTKKDILAYIDSAPAVEPEPAPAAVSPAPEPSQATEAPAAEAPAAPAEPVAPAAPPVTPPTPAPPPPRPAPALVGEASLGAGESAEPMTAMRRGVMEHMRRSLDTSAHVTSAIEVDMSKVVAIREGLKKDYQASYGVNPTYLAFIARATVDTLKDWPWVNAEIRGESIVTRQFVNLGIAVALTGGKGLIVPVIRHAEGLNLLGMARAISDIAERARTKKLLPDDVQGGTFTITNPGGFGTFHGTPIISQPQVGILGTYALVKRPWVVQDELGQDVIAIRPLMNLTLTYDHRLVDGAYAGQFLHDLRERLESWDETAY